MVYKPLSRAETNRLVSEARSGNKDSRDRIVLVNMGLVYTNARRLAFDEEEFLDFVQGGVVGLLCALNNYDMSTRFSTYASHCIQRAIFLQAHKTRCAVHMPRELRALESVAASVFSGKEEYGGQLDRADKKEVEKVLRKAVRDRPSLRQSVKRYARHYHDYRKRLAVRSLEAEAGDDNGNSNDGRRIKDFVKCDDVRDVQFDAKDILAECLKALNPRERFVLSCRFGVSYDGDSSVQTKMSYGQIGRHCGLTRERIRQIQNEALAKLREMFAERGLSLDDLVSE